MRNLNKDNITEAVLNTIDPQAGPRQREVITAMIRHLHEFVREVSLTQEEWIHAVEFLYRAGEISNPSRNEFILISDVLGASSLVDIVNDRAPDATETSALGPFFVENTPMLAVDEDMIEDNAGLQGIVRGKVLNPGNDPIPGALLEIWQTADNGLYENVDPDQPANNLRRSQHSDGEGRYGFKTIQPVSYKVPEDGAGGELLDAMGRHPWRPAHLHFKITAGGYFPLVTELYVAEDEYIDDDAVFGVRDSLCVSFATNPSQEEARQLGLKAPFWTVDFDFHLKPE